MKKFLMAFLLVFSFSISAQAATYYVDAAASDDTGDGSVGSPKKYIQSGIALLSAGDTLQVADGTYTNSSDVISGMPSGSAGAYTTIQAETDYGVILATTTVPYGGYIDVNNKSYVKIKGFMCHGSHDPMIYVRSGSNHIIIKACGSNYGGSGQSSGILVYDSTYVLFEDCFCFGPARYPFSVLGSSTYDAYVVFRRCLSRFDYANTAYPCSAFASYKANRTYYQNCIVIDGKNIYNPAAYAAISSPYYGVAGFKAPNGSQNSRFDGCIVLNFEGPAFYMESYSTGTVINNCVAWDLKEVDPNSYGAYKATMFARTFDDAGTCTVTQCTTGAVQCTGNHSSILGGVFLDCNNGNTVTNSIFYGYTLNQSGEYVMQKATSSYNCFYGTSGGSGNGTIGTGSLTAVNPLTSGLLYLPQIQGGSTLQSSGQSGQQMGATIMYKIGVDGTLYGESGWNTTTANSLWPYPYEDTIKTECSNFYKAANAVWTGSPAMTGARGFCAGSKTLTQYIWDYLGNTDGVYGSSAGATPIITSSATLPETTQGTAYSTTLAAVGGTSPYTWSISAGSLPSGLSLASGTGIISGTTTGSGSSSFTVKVTDSLSEYSTLLCSIVVNEPIAFPNTSQLDAFTDSDGTLLTSHSASWTSAWTAGMQIQSNAATGVAGEDNAVYWNAGQYADCEAWTTSAVTDASGDCQLFVRYDFTTDTGYLLSFNNSNSSWGIYRVDGTFDPGSVTAEDFSAAAWVETNDDGNKNSGLLVLYDSGSRLKADNQPASSTSYYVKDEGSGSMTDFKMSFDYAIRTGIQNGAYGMIAGAVNTAGEIDAITSGSLLIMNDQGDSGNFVIELHDVYNSQSDSANFALSLDTIYHIVFQRTSSALSAEIYDATGTTLLDTISVSTFSSTAWQYVELLAGKGASGDSTTIIHQISGLEIIPDIASTSITSVALVSGTQPVESGDSVGIAAVGTTITAYYKDSVGAWTTLGSTTDSTYASGYIGFGVSLDQERLTEFGGGELGSAPAEGDTSAPAAVSDLSVISFSSTSVTVQWTAPSDNTAVTAYDFRYSTGTMTSGSFATDSTVTSNPTPQGAGTTQTFTFSGLTAGTPYEFGMKSRDAAGNISSISNVATQTTASASTGVFGWEWSDH